MKKSAVKTIKIKAYKAKKIAIKDMGKIMNQSKEALGDLLNIKPGDLFLDF